MENNLKKEVQWKWDGIIIYNSSNASYSVKEEASGYVTEEHVG